MSAMVFSPALPVERPRSDPYVIVRAAGVEQKTPVIMNNLNPVWEDQMQKQSYERRLADFRLRQEGNLFTFDISADDHIVELKELEMLRHLHQGTVMLNCGGDGFEHLQRQPLGQLRAGPPLHSACPALFLKPGRTRLAFWHIEGMWTSFREKMGAGELVPGPRSAA